MRLSRTFFAFLALAFLFSALTAAADDGPRYTVGDLPEGWKTESDATGADKAYRLGESGVSILVNATCEVYSQVPLKALTAHLLIDITDREILSREETTIDYRDAMVTVVKGKLDGGEVQMDLRVVKIDDCVYDLAYVAAPESFGEGHADFEALVKSFHASREAR